MTAKRKRKPKPKRKKPPIPPPVELPEPRTVRLRPASIYPTKAELEEPVRIDATPDELAAAILRPVRIVTDKDA
ncbi:MAG: hypothetical protein OXM58_12310 [Rhodospirillaceae bacterium]|nr:hypothetical protein [Rhodospirillaceae bacterium]MDE0616386.1 hypothetical protein [Rhodospirillaceae bacterium]